MPRVAFATWRGLPALSDDDRLAVAPLAERGIAVDPASWTAGTLPWDDFDGIVLRSTWDYHLRPARFLRWLAAREAAGTPVWNRPALVRDNLHKGYLLALERAGVTIEPTAILERGADPALGRILADRGWAEAVVKPAVSASAHGTWRVAAGEADVAAPRLAALLEQGDVLVQRYDPRVAETGEWSLMFFDGAFSHAVLKRPAAGDFRVQPRLGGSQAGARPAAGLVADAGRVLAGLDDTPLYARVDGVADGERLVVMELELIEPSLFLAADPAAPARFAAALADRVNSIRAARL